MAEGTRLAKIDEMMGVFKETTETQGRMLQELMQRITIMDSKIENISSNSSKERGEDSNERSGNRNFGTGSLDSDRTVYTRMSRLDFPMFDGTDPPGWLYRAEQFYVHQQTPVSQRLLMASFHMEGKALQWFRWMERSGAMASWEDFAKALMVRFGPSQYEDPTALLSKLRQANTVEHYQSQFEELANRTDGLNESFMVSCFVGGLKEEIRLSVQMLKPLTLTDAIGLARMQEEKVMVRRRQSRPEVGRSASTSNAGFQKLQTPPIKMLTPAECKERRDRGLCYNCDEKFALGYKCKVQKLFLMEGNWPEEASDEQEVELAVDDAQQDGVQEEAAWQPEISLHAIAGSHTPQTMRVKGRLGKATVMVLVDSGSTHNFMDPTVARKTNLTVIKGGRFEVTVANGDQLPCSGRCLNVEMVIQGVLISADFYLLGLGGCDVVLGAQWLQKLGPITWDFTNLTMDFNLGKKSCSFKGENSKELEFLNNKEAKLKKRELQKKKKKKEEIEMENGSKKWGFRANKELTTVSDITIRGVLIMIMNNLDAGDERPIIPLGHGDPSAFPCFRTNYIAEDAIVDAVRSAKFNSYAPTVGILPARRSIAEYLSRDLPYKLSADDVYLTVGCTQAIEVALSVLARPGANILLPRPGFPFYEARAAFSHLQVRHFDLLPEKGWEVDLDAVEALADENTVAMVIINPGNPCGNVFTYQHLLKVAETAKKLGILVIADEVYGHQSFGSNPFVPMGVFGSIAPVLTLGSISKRWIVPGWRLGWLVTSDPNGILKETKVVDCIKGFLNIIADPATFIQGAVPQILEQTKEDFFMKIIDTLRQTSGICYDKIKEIPCITCPHKPDGSTFVMVKLNLSLLEDINDDLDFCSKLAKEESVIVLPGVAVGLKNWLRITFAIEPSSLEDGLGRIKSFYQRHAKQQ
ncbi:hypothetical protein HHK36_005278 [Tetracentron sinense]|uniref:Tyrosine aminotransferase n=1 Tax=Tetracentron sinense TaxID=13715 RepID=A0A835DQK4_TETSI|nr:hypothetical protein HHK36_005278 [Tetracentron sinense]